MEIYTERILLCFHGRVGLKFGCLLEMPEHPVHTVQPIEHTLANFQQTEHAKQAFPTHCSMLYKESISAKIFTS